MMSTLIDPKKFRISNGLVHVGENSYSLTDVREPRYVAPAHGASGAISFSVPARNLYLVCLNFSPIHQSYMESEFRKISNSNSIAA
jgi:hypothetical protein